MISAPASQQEGCWLASGCLQVPFREEFSCTFVSVDGCSFLCDPVLNWPHVQGVTLSSPDDSKERRKQPQDPEFRKRWVLKMNQSVFSKDTVYIKVFQMTSVVQAAPSKTKTFPRLESMEIRSALAELSRIGSGILEIQGLR